MVGANWLKVSLFSNFIAKRIEIGHKRRAQEKVQMWMRADQFAGVSDEKISTFYLSRNE